MEDKTVEKKKEIKSTKPAKAPKATAKRVLMIVYIVLVAIAVLIVALYCFWKFGVKPPDIPNNNDPTPPAISASVKPAGPTGGVDEPDPTQPVSERRPEVYTCLIIGIDRISSSTDTIMVATFDVPNKKVGLVSIPRDTVVRRDYHNGGLNKVNAAYALGGVKQLDQELEELLGIPIDYYVKIDVRAFEKLVNAVGGVEFDVPRDMDYDDPEQDLHIHLKAGYQKLNGEQAMGLVRFRQDNYGNDSFGDVGRTGVQQAFLKSMLSQVMSGADVTSIPGLFDVLLNHVETDADLNAALYFGKALLGMDLDGGIETETLPANWHSPYMWVEEEEALAVINKLLNPFNYEITADMVEFHKR